MSSAVSHFYISLRFDLTEDSKFFSSAFTVLYYHTS